MHANGPAGIPGSSAWKLEDARARFSEVVRSILTLGEYDKGLNFEPDRSDRAAVGRHCRHRETSDRADAATAIEHDLCLVTRNIRDVSHTGARLFNPWDDKPGRPMRR